MRRSSVVVPLLLILIGLLFLINNLRPELSLLSFIGQYWPFLLIGWGVLRLAEIAYGALRGGGVSTGFMSGGEWVLVLVVIMIGSTVYSVAGFSRHWSGIGPFNLNGMEWLGQPFDYPITEQRQAVPKNARIVIENLRGNARVAGADTDSVTVSGRKTIRALQQGDADQADHQSPLEFSVQGDRVVIRTNQERVGGDRRITEDLTITVPRSASVEGHGRLGDFEISDLAGEVSIDSDNAGVRLQNIGGQVRVDTRNSDIIRAVNITGAVDVKGRGQEIELESIKGPASVDGSYSGNLRFQKLEKSLRFQSSQTQMEIARVPGMVNMTLGELNGNDLVGPFKLTTKSKDVQLTNVTESVEIDLQRGDVELTTSRLPLPKVDVRTLSGNVELGLPTSARFDLHARTQRGEIDNQFGGSLKPSSGGRGASLDGSTGQGPAVRVETNRGSITLRKASATPPAVPEPPQAPKAPVRLKVESQ